MRHDRTSRVAAMLAVTAVVAATATPGAQRRRADNSVHGMPVATNTIRRTPDAFVGKVVTISAAIEDVLSPAAFVVDQRRAAGPDTVVALGAPVLVLAPRLTSDVARGSYFLIRGQVALFDAEAVRLALGVGALPPGLAERFAGQPIMVAASVLDSAYRELMPDLAAALPATAAAPGAQ